MVDRGDSEVKSSSCKLRTKLTGEVNIGEKVDVTQIFNTVVITHLKF